MKTIFILMAQYSGLAVIPLDTVCTDYFFHLDATKLKRKVALGEIDLPIVQIEGSQKSARGVHINDLAQYIDKQHQAAKDDHDKLWGRKKTSST
ncbi:MAG TPA: pyocin activator PrtN family protein [Thiopseudomonas sp.]|nr:pyocin activator PrtN family protein [Thiopseudomonas sp.]